MPHSQWQAPTITKHIYCVEFSFESIGCIKIHLLFIQNVQHFIELHLDYYQVEPTSQC